MSFENENLLISDIGALYKFQNNNLISDYTLNVCNSESVNILNKLGCKKITLSVETPINDVFKLINNFDNIEVIVYGKPELMALKDFKYKENNLLLEDRMGNKFPIINDSYTSIIHFKNINLTNYNLNTNIRYEFFNETEEEINNLLKGL
jgi:hypothetical protein